MILMKFEHTHMANDMHKIITLETVKRQVQFCLKMYSSPNLRIFLIFIVEIGEKINLKRNTSILSSI